MRIEAILMLAGVVSCGVFSQQQSSSFFQKRREPVMVRLSPKVAERFVLKEVMPDASDLKSTESSEVRIVFEISETGTVDWAAGIEGNRALFERSTKAIRQWQFKPYLVNGRPIRVDSSIYFHFSKGKVQARFCPPC
ncbi:MAG TPA: energy transducer TonB [Candidatus Angelobacter sp.]|nr:energy transducer TonB [Candidatus Angelobacter sp.]